MNHAKTFILLAAMTALFGGVGYLVGGAPGMTIAFIVALGINIFSYWNSDRLVLSAYRAHEVTPTDPNPVIRAFVGDVHSLAQKAQLPAPRVYLIDNAQPNAFATGRDPAHAAVAATTGLLGMLTREEVAGVMAHELAHIKNRDTLVMTVTATIAGAIGLLANFAWLLNGNRDREGGGSIFATIALMVFAPLAASVVQMAISRAREYEADRIGAEICGRPLWLASALQKIERGARSLINPEAERNPASAHVFIINPLRGGRGDNLFTTHPSTANRVERLQALDAARRAAAGENPSAAGPSILPVTGAGKSAARGPWG